MSDGAECSTWNWKSPATCLVVCSSTEEKQKKRIVSTKGHNGKKKTSAARLVVAGPRNCHLKMRLIQPLPLRAAQRKKSRKTIMHRCNQGRFQGKKQKQKKAIYYTYFLFAHTRNNPRRLWFVFLQTLLMSWPQIWLLLLFYFKRCVLVLLLHISVLASSLDSIFSAWYFKHYSMMLLCRETDVISPSVCTHHFKFCTLCFLYVTLFRSVIRTNSPWS